MDGLATGSVRFAEIERYDPVNDLEVVRLMAITGRGTYHAEIPIDGPRSLRSRRKAFQQRVLSLMDEGTPPCEVELTI